MLEQPTPSQSFIRWSAQITYAAMTVYAASVLELGSLSGTVTDGNASLQRCAGRSSFSQSTGDKNNLG